ncbi:MAG TPA: hypothetical protein VNB22_01775 [Pyrinomonadaceae bacterium]|jgi:hypothetical protein|nr:hypothetical protein [Pyrinomonadaceae bacterium]
MKNISLRTATAIITFFIGVALAVIWIKPPSEQLPLPDNTSRTQPTLVSNVAEFNEESEKYAVYSIVLNEVFVKEGFKSLVIFDKNSNIISPQELERKFDLPVPYILMDEQEYKNHFYGGKEDSERKSEKRNLSKSIAKLPRPIASARLSQVMFNEEKTTAKVMVEYVYCGLCGFGKSLLLEKSEGSWKIVDITGLWVS